MIHANSYVFCMYVYTNNYAWKHVCMYVCMNAELKRLTRLEGELESRNLSRDGIRQQAVGRDQSHHPAHHHVERSDVTCTIREGDLIGVIYKKKNNCYLFLK